MAAHLHTSCMCGDFHMMDDFNLLCRDHPALMYLIEQYFYGENTDYMALVSATTPYHFYPLCIFTELCHITLKCSISVLACAIFYCVTSAFRICMAQFTIYTRSEQFFEDQKLA